MQTIPALRLVLLALMPTSTVACEIFCPSGCVNGWWNGKKGLDLFCPLSHGVAPKNSADTNYCSYNIPSLLRTGNGTLLAFVEARKESCVEDQGWVDLKLRRSLDSGKTWAPSSLVYGESNANEVHTIGDAQPVWDRDTGFVHLVFTRDNHDVFYTKSLDDGLTWLPPRNISSDVQGHRNPGWIFTGHAIGVQTSTGRLIVMLHGPCTTIYSDDHGATWHKGGSTSGGECQAAEIKPGLLILTARNTKKVKDQLFAYTYIGYSTDNGMSWTTTENQDLRSPTLQGGVEASIVVHPNGNIYHSQPDNTVVRQNMVIKVSKDGGHTWGNQAHVWPSGAGYSSLVVLGTAVDSPLGLFYVRTDSVISDVAFIPNAATFIEIPVTASDGSDAIV